MDARLLRVLITGVDGVLGSNIALTLSDRFDVLGLHQRRDLTLDIPRLARWTSSEELANVLHWERPDWIIHCGRAARAAWDMGPGVIPPCLDQLAAEIEQIQSMAAAVSAKDGGLIVVSSDSVFTGPWMFHTEDSAVAPTPAAFAIRAIEEAAAISGALVVRTSAYGWAPAGALGYAADLFSHFAQGVPIEFEREEYATPILATGLAELLLAARQQHLRGIYHVGGAERVSRREFAATMAEAFHLRTASFAPSRRASLLNAAMDTSLSSVRAREALGKPLPMLRDGLARFARQSVTGYRARMQAPLQAATRMAA